MDADEHIVQDEVQSVDWWVFSPPSPALPCRAGHLGFRLGDCFLNLAEVYCRGGISHPGHGRITRDDIGVYAVIVCDQREVSAYAREATAGCPVRGNEELTYQVPYDGEDGLNAYQRGPIRVYRFFARGGIRYEGLYWCPWFTIDEKTDEETDEPLTDAYVHLVRQRDQIPLFAVEAQPTARHTEQWALYVSAVERDEAHPDWQPSHRTVSESRL
ncbi:MAG: hypothetical protein OHK93_006996 [Ramalina farinacea]|uniref:Uncharacterized protein n=1 Tax=Ramalina farinacea TaxID=258253 RepID=A0AA43TU04_9LECA|nr:hypothetical protein [Ramalina farinacea]